MLEHGKICHSMGIEVYLKRQILNDYPEITVVYDTFFC